MHRMLALRCRLARPCPNGPSCTRPRGSYAVRAWAGAACLELGWPKEKASHPNAECTKKVEDLVADFRGFALLPSLLAPRAETFRMPPRRVVLLG